MNLKFQFKIVVICLLMSSCLDTCMDEAEHESFDIAYNKSNRSVWLTFQIYDKLGAEVQMNGFREVDSQKIWAIPNEYSTVRVSLRISDWQDTFDYFDTDTLPTVFFDIDTIQKYGWDKVRIDYKILARYDLTMENIIDLGGIVPYPLQDSTVKIYYPEGLNPFKD